MADLLSGKVALVTGCAQGIGLAVADLFREQGARVEGVDRQAGSGWRQLDLAHLEGIAPFVASLPECPTVVVNAAGLCLTRSFFEVEPSGFELTLKINLIAPILLSQAIASRLIAEGKVGSVVHVSSNSAFNPKLEQLDYGASKAGLVSATRSSALSLAPHGIRVNAIAPGIIDTPMTQGNAERRSLLRGISSEEAIEALVKQVPLGRIGSALEVAQVALFLASDLSSYVTGQTYLVDGGQLMR